MNYPAFLAAIRDAPGDDLPRHVCADWLDDQGEADRAEFIRVQLELTRGLATQEDPKLEPLRRERTVELLRRLRALIVQYRTRWLGILATHAPHSIFERGFIESVVLGASALLDHGPEIFAAHPIHRLALRGLENRLGD